MKSSGMTIQTNATEQYFPLVSQFLLGSWLTRHKFALVLDSNRSGSGCGISTVNWQIAYHYAFDTPTGFFCQMVSTPEQGYQGCFADVTSARRGYIRRLYPSDVKQSYQFYESLQYLVVQSEDDGWWNDDCKSVRETRLQIVSEILRFGCSRPFFLRHLQQKVKIVEDICSNFILTVELQKAYAIGLRTPFINTSHIEKRKTTCGALNLAEHMCTTMYGNQRTINRTSKRTPVLATLYSLDGGRLFVFRCFRGKYFLSTSPKRIDPRLPLLEDSLQVFSDAGSVWIAHFCPSCSKGTSAFADGILFNPDSSQQLLNDEISMLELNIVCSSTGWIILSVEHDNLPFISRLGLWFWSTLCLCDSDINLQVLDFFPKFFALRNVETFRVCLRMTKNMRMYVKIMSIIGIPNPTIAKKIYREQFAVQTGEQCKVPSSYWYLDHPKRGKEA